MTLTYQDTQSGKAFVLTDLVISAIWETKRLGSPSKLTVQVLDAKNVTWQLGSVLTLQDEGKNLFYGYLFDITLGRENQVTLVAYDQLRYLKNRDTYVFSAVRADQIIAQICADFSLRVGALPNTGYVLPSLVEDNVTLLDICLQALEETLQNGGGRYLLWDDFGTLRLELVRQTSPLLVLGEESMVTEFTYHTSIDRDTYNRVVVYQDNKKTGGRTRLEFGDSENQQAWGILQCTQKASQTATDLQTLGRSLLTLHNHPTTTLTLRALEVPGLRAGTVILVRHGDVSQLCLVEECVHQLHRKTMELKVRAYPC